MRAKAAGAAALATLALLGCPAPHTPRRAPLPLPLEVEVHHHDEPALAGVLHVVAPGETMWRIARTYGIEAADLMETNGIADARALAVGTELFVPGATRVMAVPAVGEEAAVGSATSTSTAASTPTATSTTSASTGRPASLPPRGAGGDGQGEGGTKPSRVASATAARPPAADESDAPLAWPLKGVLYGRYGVRAGKRHDGIDIAAPEGTPVLAAADGAVIYAGEQAGYGAIVILRHGEGLVTLYAHNSRLLVEDGDRVKRGQPIARVGQTGRTSGPHLHFEVRQGTRPKNPLLFLP